MFIIKQNDQRPFYQTTLTRGGVAVDLSTASGLTFKMRKQGRVENKVDSSAIILTPASGIVEYRWNAGDTDEAGTYFAEFEVLWPDSTTETFPSLSYEIVRVESDLD